LPPNVKPWLGAGNVGVVVDSVRAQYILKDIHQLAVRTPEELAAPPETSQIQDQGGSAGRGGHDRSRDRQGAAFIVMVILSRHF
jgi:hypothetical protein